MKVVAGYTDGCVRFVCVSDMRVCGKYTMKDRVGVTALECVVDGVCVCVCVCVCVRVYVCVCVFCVYVFFCMYVCTYVCVYACVRMYVYVCVN